MIIRKSQIRVDESNLKNGRGLVKREFIVEGENYFLKSLYQKEIP